MRDFCLCVPGVLRLCSLSFVLALHLSCQFCHASHGHRHNSSSLGSKFCAVSSLLGDIEENPRFSYPSDLFCAPKQVTCQQQAFRMMNASSMTSPYLPCTSVEEYRKPSLCNHVCIGKKLPELSPMCPVHSPNLVQLVHNKSFPGWNISSSICRLRESLLHISNSSGSGLSDDVVNVIILGGSVTLGHRTEGCMHNTTSQWGVFPCAWGSLLQEWAEKTDTPIKVWNLAQAGFSSGLMADYFSFYLLEKNITLKATDLIFLDHSANDAIQLGGNIYDNSLQVGVERLLFQIKLALTSSNVKANKLSKHRIPLSKYKLPTVVMLEFYPLETAKDYSLAYRAVARQYGLHVWPLKEALRSAAASRNQAPYVDYLQGKFGHHMPWFVHLWYADYIVAMLMYSMQKCDSGREWNGLHEYQGSEVIYTEEVGEPTPEAGDQLKPMCNDALPRLVDAQAKSAFMLFRNTLYVI